MQDDRENKPSASELYRIVGCGGYLQFKRGALNHVQRQPHPDDELGTLTHLVLSNEGNGAERLPTDHARWVVREALAIRDRMHRELFGDSPTEVIKEARFWLRDISGNKVFSGQLDYGAISRSDSSALVVDYKSLYGDTPEADSNWQLTGQAASLYEDMKAQGVTLKTIFCAVIQPCVNRQPSLVKYEAGDMVDMAALVRRRLREAEIPNMPRTPGSHCKFCPMAGACPEAQAFGMVLYNRNLLARIEWLQADEVARLLPMFPTLTKVMEAVKERAEGMAAVGELPGYAMKDGYIRTDIKDIPGFYADMQNYCEVPKEEFYRNLRVSKEGIEELFRENYVKRHGGTRKAASDIFEELVTKHGERRPTKARLVAVKTTAQIT